MSGVTLEQLPAIVAALKALERLRASDRARGFYDITYQTPRLDGETLFTTWSDGLEGRGMLIWDGREWVKP